jgi:hypothetical protein
LAFQTRVNPNRLASLAAIALKLTLFQFGEGKHINWAKIHAIAKAQIEELVSKGGNVTVDDYASMRYA